MHLLSPPISPSTIPHALSLTNILLPEFCPSCISPDKLAQSAAEELISYGDESTAASEQWRSAVHAMHRAMTLVIMASENEENGWQDEQTFAEAEMAEAEMSEATANHDRACLDVAKIQSRQSRARRRWGKACEGRLGAVEVGHSAKKRAVSRAGKAGKIRPKLKLKLKIKAEDRKYMESIAFDYGAVEFYNAPGLDLP